LFAFFVGETQHIIHEIPYTRSRCRNIGWHVSPCKIRTLRCWNT